MFFVNITGTQDWGGDYAQYIHHAQNIADGKPYSLTGYIYNPENKWIGPPSYSPGFPLLLAPVIAVFGFNLTALQYFIAFVFLCYFIFLFHFLTHFLSKTNSLILVLIFAYNHLILSFKDEIVADMPFSLMVLLVIMLLFSKSLKPIPKTILIIVVSSFAILTKDAGYFVALSFLIACIASLFRIKIKGVEFFQQLKIYWQFLAFGAILFLPYIFSWSLETENAMSSFTTLFSLDAVFFLIAKNLTYYSEVLLYFFSPFTEHLRFLAFWVSSFFLVFALIGFLERIIKRFHFIDLLFLSYLAVILLYPYVGSGFRFLYPIIPFFTYYFIHGLKSLTLIRQVKMIYLRVFAVFVIAVLYWRADSDIIRYQDIIPDGPFQPQAKEAFHAVELLTPDTASVMFFKPRVLALFTTRNSIAESDADSGNSVMIMDRFNIDYVLIHKNQSKIKEDDLTNFNLVFANDLFALYEKK